MFTASLVITLVLALNYLVFGVGAYFLFNKVLINKISHRKIFDSVPKETELKREALGSISNLGIFAIIFLATFSIAKKFDLPVLSESRPSILMFLIGFFVIQMLHDAYFYWTHRLMHRVSFLRKIHVDHHLSVYPTPLGSMSFHPIEGVVHAMFFVVIAITLPFHWLTIVVFYSFQSYINMWGHTNFEFWPKNLFRIPVLKWLNTPTHHIQHHKDGRYNFGIYYNFWDNFCGTNNPNYKSHYEATQNRLFKEGAQ